MKRALIACFAFAAAAAGAQDAVETLHGIAVPDPYRALEDAPRPEAQAFFREHDARARAVLERLPGRAALAARIRELSASGAVVTNLRLEAGKVFYLRRAPGEARAALCMRDGLQGAERVLVDPAKLGEGGRGVAIDWFAPSPDARHVAYGVSTPGSDDSTLRIHSIAAAHDLAETVGGARFNDELRWHPDGRSFYYARLSEGAGARRYASVRVYRHVLGRKASQDEVVFAPGVGGARDIPDYVRPWIVLPLESRYAYAVARQGTRNEIAVHVAEQKDLAAARPRWRKVIAVADEVTAIEAWRNDLFVLSHHRAPHYRILRLDAGNPSLANARVVLGEGDSVIQSMALARDALYLRTTVGGLDRLERVALGIFGAKHAEYVKTPFEVGIAELVAHPRRPGVLLRLQGWIEPPAVVEVDAKTGNLRNTALQPPSKADFSAMDEVRLYAPAEDGTKIPVTLLYRKTTQLTGANPTLLTVYGAHGISARPDFDPARLAWLERGGVYAIAHVRGGGEYGERWHEAGRKAAKVNTVTDFIAVADFLVKYGFTQPAKLAIAGAAEGGIAVGGAAVRRPDLFAAVVARDPWMDMLRAEFGARGVLNVPEFGSVATREGFQALYAVSAYHQVKDGTPYPAVLLMAEPANPGADAGQAAKMAARLEAASTSGKPVLLRERGGATRAQRDEELADIYAFVLWQFGDPDFQPRP